MSTAMYHSSMRGRASPRQTRRAMDAHGQKGIAPGVIDGPQFGSMLLLTEYSR